MSDGDHPLTRIKVELEMLQRGHEGHAQDIDRLYKTVRDGNGDRPLVERTSRLEHRVDILEKTHDRYGKRAWEIVMKVAPWLLAAAALGWRLTSS